MQREIPKITSGIHVISESSIVQHLELVQCVIEDKFVAAGDILQRSLDGIGDLIESLDRFSKIFDQPTVAATKVDLMVAAAKLCTLPASHARQTDHIVQLNRSRAKLSRHVFALRCHFAFLGAFCRNASLLAGDGPERKLTQLVASIVAYVADGSQEIVALEAELSDLQNDLESAATHREILGQKIDAQLPELPEELSSAAKIVSSHFTAVAATAEQVGTIARSIKGRVERILAALQFGDITRQRINHVLDCLIRAEADAVYVPQAIRHRFLASCNALIAMQLAQISTDFDREAAEIEKNLVEMAGDAKALLKLHDIAFDRTGSENYGFLHVLAARIAAAQKLVATIVAADISATKTGQATIEAVHRLAARIGRVQNLRRNLGTIDYTAAEDSRETIVKAEFRTQSLILKETAKAGLSTLDNLLHLANTIVVTGGHYGAPDSTAVAAEEALTVAESRICEARDISETDITEVAAQGDAIVHILALSDARLRLRREIGDILSVAAAQTAYLAHGAYGPADVLPESLVRTLMGFSGSYTMAPERVLHRAYLLTFAASNIDMDRIPPAEDSEAVLF